MSTARKKNQDQILIRKPSFVEGDRVHYNLPDCDLGVGLVISVAYYLSEDEYQYMVSWGGTEAEWFSEVELSHTEVFK